MTRLIKKKQIHPHKNNQTNRKQHKKGMRQWHFLTAHPKRKQKQRFLGEKHT